MSAAWSKPMKKMASMLALGLGLAWTAACGDGGDADTSVSDADAGIDAGVDGTSGAEAGTGSDGSTIPLDGAQPADAGRDAAPVLDEAGCFGTWTSLPSMLRVNAEAVTVGTTVHLLGGFDGDERISADWAQLDTTTGVWTHRNGQAMTPRAHAVVGSRIVAFSNAGTFVFDTAANTVSTASSTGLPAGMSLTAPVVVTAAGAEVFVWDPAVAKGALYNPATNAWSAAASTNAPTSPCCGGATWTGTDVVLFGGFSASSALGYRYNPGTTTWTALPSSGAPAARIKPLVEWTGADVLVYGDQDSATTGARYRPLTDDWIPIAATNAPGGVLRRIGRVGAKVAVIEGQQGGKTAALYDPALDTWTPFATTGAPDSRRDHSIAFTSDSVYVIAGSPQNATPSVFPAYAYRYLVGTSTWSNDGLVQPPIVLDHAGNTGGSAFAGWSDTARRVVVRNASYSSFQGGRLDPDTGVWTPLSMTNAPLNTDYDVSGTVIGGAIYLWSSTRFDRYDPVTDLWTPIPIVGVSSRAEPWVVPVGNKIAIFGTSGSNYSYTNTGGLYDPAGPSWTATGTVNAPTLSTVLAPATAIGGGKVAVWGGGNGGPPLATGAIYDASSNAWTTMSTTGAPSARTRHGAIWTGSELLIIGGTGPAPMSAGAAYNPTTDSWRPLPTLGAPTGDVYVFPAAVWTGTKALVWGAGNGAPAGAAYDPSTDKWSCMTAVHQPFARTRPLFAWTGTQLFVYAGFNAPSDTGGFFTP